MKKIFIVLLLLGAGFPAFARQMSFTGYSISDGLSQSVVNCIFQDSRGFIWIGTQNGLNRFDGYSFRVYTFKPDDTTSISSNWVYAVTEDPEGNLWVGTKDGLNKFMPARNCFRKIRYTVPYPEDVTQYVYDVKCSRNGTILINTPPVLTVCDPATLSFTHHLSPLAYDGSVKDYRIPLLEDGEGTVWTGSTRGLARFVPGNGSFTALVSGTARHLEITDDNITALCQDREGTIWIGTSRGLNCVGKKGDSSAIDLKKNGNARFLSGSFIRAVLEDDSGGLWIATEGNGLSHLQRGRDQQPVCETFTAGNSGIFHNIVLSLMTDRSGNLWVGTLSGVNKADLKEQKFPLYRKSDSPYSADLAGNVIASLYKDEKGTIWVGNWGQGLNLLDRSSGEAEHYSSRRGGRFYIPNDYVHTIFEDRAQTVWIGTRDGLMAYRPGTRSFARPRETGDATPLPDFRGLRIFRMMQSRNGDYWIATQDGLFRIQKGKSPPDRFYASAPDSRRTGSNLVYDVLEDREGWMWIGTSEGLDCWNPATGTMEHFRKEPGENNGLADNYITALCEDHLGNIWIGTSSYVNRFSKKDSLFTYFSNEQGLPGNLIYSILEDKSRGLWVATGSGLCRYDTAAGAFHAYTTEDGLQSQEFNLGAAFLSPDGELFFGGMNGFNAFYPDSLKNNPHVPALVFTGAYKMKMGKKEHLNPEYGDKILLKHNDYSFTVEFAALEYTNSSRNAYKYRMEGLDDDWIDIGNRNFIPFSNLPPGEYLLRVKGSNNDGVWNEEGISLPVRVLPPWWGSRMAYVVYVLWILAALFLLFKRREQQHARDRRILEEKVRERTLLIEEQKREIMAINAELRELNASKDRFFSIIAHDLRNPFHAIIGLSDLLLMNVTNVDPGKLKKSLENIGRSSRQAYELLENLLLWARSHTGALAFTPRKTDLRLLATECVALVQSQAAGKNIQIHTGFSGETVVPADVNMIRTVVRNLLTNALKFTFQDGEVWVDLNGDGEICTLSVRDNGTGIAPEKMAALFQIAASHTTRGTDQEPGSGLGLVLCREFVEKHGGRLEVESEEGKGSLFRMVLPVNRE